jgi:hypothetical protein
MDDFEQASLSDRSQLQYLHFEQRCIKMLFKIVGQPIPIGAAAEVRQSEEGVSCLTFRWLMGRYPYFPAKIRGVRPGYVSGDHIGYTDLFGDRFAKLPFVRHYRDFANEGDYDLTRQWVVLAFKADGRDSTALVMHNRPDETAATEAGTRILRAYGNPRVVYAIEAFSVFAAAVGSSWISV